MPVPCPPSFILKIIGNCQWRRYNTLFQKDLFVATKFHIMYNLSSHPLFIINTCKHKPVIIEYDNRNDIDINDYHNSKNNNVQHGKADIIFIALKNYVYNKLLLA